MELPTFNQEYATKNFTLTMNYELVLNKLLTGYTPLFNTKDDVGISVFLYIKSDFINKNTLNNESSKNNNYGYASYAYKNFLTVKQEEVLKVLDYNLKNTFCNPNFDKTCLRNNEIEKYLNNLNIDKLKSENRVELVQKLHKFNEEFAGKMSQNRDYVEMVKNNINQYIKLAIDNETQIYVPKLKEISTKLKSQSKSSSNLEKCAQQIKK